MITFFTSQIHFKVFPKTTTKGKISDNCYLGRASEWMVAMKVDNQEENNIKMGKTFQSIFLKSLEDS
jgi:hypothetical protein